MAVQEREQPPTMAPGEYFEKLTGAPAAAARWMAENDPTPAEFIEGAYGGAGETFLDVANLPAQALGAVIPGHDPIQAGAEALGAQAEQFGEHAAESELGAFMGALAPWMMLGPTGAFGPGAGEVAAMKRGAGALPTLLERTAAGGRFGAGAGALETAKEITQGEATPESAILNIGGGAASVAALGLAHAAVDDVVRFLMVKGFNEAAARRLAARGKKLAREMHPDFAGKNATRAEVEYRTQMMGELNAAVEAGDLARVKQIEKAWKKGEKTIQRAEKTDLRLPPDTEPPAEAPPAPSRPPEQPPGAGGAPQVPPEAPSRPAPEFENRRRAARPEAPEGYQIDLMRRAPDWLKQDNRTLSMWASNMISDFQAAEMMGVPKDQIEEAQLELFTVRRSLERQVKPEDVPELPPKEKAGPLEAAKETVMSILAGEDKVWTAEEIIAAARLREQPLDQVEEAVYALRDAGRVEQLERAGQLGYRLKKVSEGVEEAPRGPHTVEEHPEGGWLVLDKDGKSVLTEPLPIEEDARNFAKFLDTPREPGEAEAAVEAAVPTPQRPGDEEISEAMTQTLKRLKERGFAYFNLPGGPKLSYKIVREGDYQYTVERVMNGNREFFRDDGEKKFGNRDAALRWIRDDMREKSAAPPEQKGGPDALQKGQEAAPAEAPTPKEVKGELPYKKRGRKPQEDPTYLGALRDPEKMAAELREWYGGDVVPQDAVVSDWAKGLTIDQLVKEIQDTDSGFRQRAKEDIITLLEQADGPLAINEIIRGLEEPMTAKKPYSELLENMVRDNEITMQQESGMMPVFTLGEVPKAEREDQLQIGAKWKRNRDGMGVQILKATPNKKGIINYQLLFDDNHKHSFTEKQLRARFTYTGQAEAPGKAAPTKASRAKTYRSLMERLQIELDRISDKGYGDMKHAVWPVDLEDPPHFAYEVLQDPQSDNYWTVERDWYTPEAGNNLDTIRGGRNGKFTSEQEARAWAVWDMKTRVREQIDKHYGGAGKEIPEPPVEEVVTPKPKEKEDVAFPGSREDAVKKLKYRARDRWIEWAGERMLIRQHPDYSKAQHGGLSKWAVVLKRPDVRPFVITSVPFKLESATSLANEIWAQAEKGDRLTLDEIKTMETGPAATQGPKVIEVTGDARSVVGTKGSKVNPTARGFSATQEKWIKENLPKVWNQELEDAYFDRLKKKEIVPQDEPIIVKMAVPEDGTFYLNPKGVADFIYTMTGKKPSKHPMFSLKDHKPAKMTSSTINSTRVKPKKFSVPALGAKMHYSKTAAFPERKTSYKTEQGDWTNGEFWISQDALLNTPAGKHVKKIKEDVSKKPDAKRIVDQARKFTDKAEFLGYQIYTTHREIYGSIGEKNTFVPESVGYAVFVDEKGEIIPDRTLRLDTHEFMKEAIEFDEVRYDKNADNKSMVAFFKNDELAGIAMWYPVEDGELVVKGLDSPPTQPTGGANNASLGDYAAARTGERDVKGSGEDPSPEIAGVIPEGRKTHERDVFSLAFPELVELAVALGKGKFPKVKRLVARNPFVRGMFQHKKGDRRSGEIQLQAAIFRDPHQAASTLAHEIGHWIDFLPEGTLSRGNILGRIAGLVKYLKHTISRLPTEPVDFISKQDRDRLRKQAKKETRIEYEEEIEEFIEKTIGVTPEDILSIWQMYTPTAPEELHTFIKGLNTAQKKAIIQQAMKGMVPDELKRFGKTVREYTGKKIKVKRVKFTNPEQRFRELLYEELKKRDLVTKEEIWNETWGLSVEWRPLGDNPSASYLKYRKNGKEVYADVISAFLNDPALVKQRAPTTYDMLLGWMDAKPEFQATWQDLQQLASDRDMLDDHRLQRYLEMVAKGEEKRMQELTKRREGLNLAQSILHTMLESKQSWYNARRALKKARKYDPAKDPLFKLEEMLYHNSAIAWYLDLWTAEVLGPVRQIMSDVELGGWLGLKRAAVDEELGGRASKANPLGLSGEYAQRTLDKLKQRFSVEDQEVIMQALEGFAGMRHQLFNMVEEAKMLKPSLLKHMRDSVHGYSTYQVIDFLEDLPDGWVYPQVGTLKEIGNPLVETVLKDVAMLRMAHRNQAVSEAIAWLREFFPEKVIDGQFKRGARGRKHYLQAQDARGVDGAEYELVRWLSHGTMMGAYIPKDFAKGLKSPKGSGQLHRQWALATRALRAVMVDHNPFWPIWNIQRDTKAFLKKLPVGKIVEVPLPGGKKIRMVDPLTPVAQVTYELWRALPDAWKDVYRDTRTPIVREMLKNRALIQTGLRFWKAGDITEEEASRLLLERYGLKPQDHENVVHNTLNRISRLLSDPGQLTERVVKIAGYRYLKEHRHELGLTMPEIASLTRRSVGTPDIMAGGDAKKVYNSVWLFSNVAAQDIRTSTEAADKDPAVYAQKIFWYTLFPKMMLGFGAAGLLGPGLKAVFDRIPDHDKANYQIVPLGLTKDGKAVYLRFPEDHISQALGAIFWKTLTDREDFLQDFWHTFNQNFPFGLGSLNPYVDVMRQWGQYATGQNPQDFYRGRPVIPESVFKTGNRSEMRSYMLKHTWNNLGLHVLFDFNTENQGDPGSELERATRIPGLNQLLKRFIKVSDYGLQEKIWESIMAEREIRSARTLERDKMILEILKRDPSMSDRAVQARFLASGVEPAYKDDKGHKKLTTRIQTLRWRYFGDPWQRAASRVNRKEDEQMIEEMRKADEALLGRRSKR
jgi:hypothetical protein